MLKKNTIFLLLLGAIILVLFFTFNLVTKPEIKQINKAFILPHNPLFSSQINDILLSGPKLSQITTIIIFGPNHQDIGPYLISTNNYLAHKLGTDINEELIEEEHSIQTLKPLLKKRYPRAQIIPFIFRKGQEVEQIINWTNNLKGQIEQQKTLMIASVDFAHYLDQKTSAQNDQVTLQAIENYNYQLISTLNSDYLDCPTCIISFLELTKPENLKPIVLKNKYQEGTSYFFIAFRPSDSTFTPTLIPLSPTPPAQITLIATGDLSLSREINYTIIQKQNPHFPFEKIASVIQEADWAIANLEGPVISDCPQLRTGFKFCGEIQNLNGLTSAGFDALNLANNHINNFGPQGLDETIQALDNQKIKYFGLGKIDFRTIKEIDLVFLGFDDTLAPLDKTRLQAEIEKVDSQADWVIVNFHWGEEYQGQPNFRQKEIAQLAIEAGADIIIGHHPHVAQPLEYIEGKPIFYSLGNFVFDQLWSQDTRSGALGKIILSKNKIIKAEMISIYINNQYQPELVNP